MKHTQEDFDEARRLLDASMQLNDMLFSKIEEITKTCGNAKFTDKSEQHGYNMASIEFLTALHKI